MTLHETIRVENQFNESDVGEKWGISDNFTNVRISLLDGKSVFTKSSIFYTSRVLIVKIG